MNKWWKYLLSGFFGLVLISITIVPIIIYYLPNEDIVDDSIINIQKDADFKSYNFPGKGTPSDPYVIENYTITTTNAFAICINSTSKHFIIRDCYLEANNSAIYIGNVASGTANITQNVCKNTLQYGISLESAPGTILTSNICTNNSYGIHLFSSNDAVLINNICTANDYGIYLDVSMNSVLINNTCLDTGLSIYLYHSDDAILLNNNCNAILLIYVSHSVLTNNTCKNHAHGIYVYHSSYVTVTNNTCISNDHGIYLSFSSYVTLTNNTLINCSLKLNQPFESENYTYEVENNTVNGKELGFFVNNSSLIISEPAYGQLIFINCSDMIIRNQVLSNISTGLLLFYCDNMTLSNNLCTNSTDAIFLRYSSRISLTNNNCSFNSGDGIKLYHSSNATIKNNVCYNNDHGIFLDYSSDYAFLFNNSLNNNLCGVYIDNYIATVTNNTFNNNTYGVFLSGFSNTSVINNTFENNDYGLWNFHSIYCIVTYNLFRNNSHYAIMVRTYAFLNIIHHNSFIDNNLGGTSQALDDGHYSTFNNTWYDKETNEGNNWSDWTGVGEYHIDGEANATDPYPLSSPPFT